MRKIIIITLAIFVPLVMLVGCGAFIVSTAMSSLESNALNTPVASVQPRTPVASAAPSPRVDVQDGTWLVGEDIRPGRYRAAKVLDATQYCYWEISEGGITEKNDLPQGGRPTVHLKEGREFSSQDCGGWVRTGGE